MKIWVSESVADLFVLYKYISIGIYKNIGICIGWTHIGPTLANNIIKCFSYILTVDMYIHH